MTKVTKAELQEQVESLQGRVASLQNELTERSFQLSDVENQLTFANQQTGDRVNELIDRAGDRVDLENAVVVVEGLANQLAWTISSVQSISLYHPTQLPANVSVVTESILAESQPFLQEFNAGHYTSEAILGDNHEETVVDLNDLGLGDLLLQMFPETTQEIPDDACEVCGDPDFNCGG